MAAIFRLSNVPFFLHIIIEVYAGIGLLFSPHTMLKEWNVSLEDASGLMCQEESSALLSTVIAAVYALFLPSLSKERFIMAWICFPFHVMSGVALPLYRTYIARYPMHTSSPSAIAFTHQVVILHSVIGILFIIWMYFNYPKSQQRKIK